MRRVFGFVACASLLTAPCWVNRGEAAEPVPARDAVRMADSAAPALKGTSLTATQLFLKGRQDYLSGRYDEAVAELEAADRASGGLSDYDRERLPGWLTQARSKTTGLKTTAGKTTAAQESR
ncbi:MAG TPA: hypothetical protein VGH74_17680, partial [Planctomycetaceae bacterium]